MPEPVFFAPSRRITAGEIATLIGAELRNRAFAGVEINGVAALSEGRPDKLVFAEGKRNAPALSSLNAAALICSPELEEYIRGTMAVLISKRPQAGFAAIARLIFPAAVRPGPVTGETGISPAAHIARDAHIEPGAIIEAGAVVGIGAGIGAGTVIAPNAVVGAGCQIGRDCFIGPGSSIQASLIGNRVIVHAGARIGQDGFGFVPGAAGLEKMPQIGRVIIQDDVEIGANTTVDRGALGDTVIGDGTKIDNLVQIAHNVRIGRGCAIAAHCGIAGSVVIGDFALLGGRVGLADHVTIGSGAQLAASSGVMHDVPAGARWMGTPAQPIKSFFREVTTLRNLALPAKKRSDQE